MTDGAQTNSSHHPHVDGSARDRLAWRWQNIRAMHFLHRVAEHFDHAGVPLMVLKGAALFYTVYPRPDQRPMGDLDLLVRPGDARRAMAVLEQAGCQRCQVLLREDFFPRFYYEAEFNAGQTFSVVMDLHARPFRTLRYSRFVPDDALWRDASSIDLGSARIHLPSAGDMVLHMAVHNALHGQSEGKWPVDLSRWINHHRDRIDWDDLLHKAASWRLALPLRQGLALAQQALDRPVVPESFMHQLRRVRVNWRDRLALWHAPRDDAHPVGHVLINTVTTPGLRFATRYFLAATLPDREHMLDWYGKQHPGWLALAHAMRVTQPLWRRLRFAFSWHQRYRIAPAPHEQQSLAVLATRTIQAGQNVARFHTRPCDGKPMFWAVRTDAQGRPHRVKLLGDMRMLGVSEKPNAQLVGGQVVALTRILPDEPVCIGVDRQIHRPAGEQSSGRDGVLCRDDRDSRHGGADAVEADGCATYDHDAGRDGYVGREGRAGDRDRAGKRDRDGHPFGANGDDRDGRGVADAGDNGDVCDVCDDGAIGEGREAREGREGREGREDCDGRAVGDVGDVGDDGANGDDREGRDGSGETGDGLETNRGNAPTDNSTDPAQPRLAA